jgi:hypothetical protein
VNNLIKAGLIHHSLSKYVPNKLLNNNKAYTIVSF